MLLASFPAGPWQTNCYLVAGESDDGCLIIDPGFQSADRVERVLRDNGRRGTAVLLTHGHLDHTFDAAELARRLSVPCYVHAADRGLLADPLRGMPPETPELLRQLSGAEVGFAEPPQVRELADGDRLELAGVALDVRHAPGHTPGSVLYVLDLAAGGHPEAVPGELEQVVFSGDVLFAGAIGRTDLPGGDDATMRRSLRERVLSLPDPSAILPGHGPQTLLGRERLGNPYLGASYLPDLPDPHLETAP